MASVVLSRGLAAAGVALVLSAGAGIALAVQAAADTPGCTVKTGSQSNSINCTPTLAPTPGVGGAPSEQDLTSANDGRHH